MTGVVRCPHRATEADRNVSAPAWSPGPSALDRPQRPRHADSSATAQPKQPRLVGDLHLELLRLVQLGTSLRAGNDVVRLLADAAADLAARRLDLRRGLLPLEGGERAGQD